MQEEPINKDIWVGLWKGRRHVVYDPAIQPENTEFMFLYFVQGKSLCTRLRSADRSDVRTVKEIEAQEFAISQYHAWRKMNRAELEEKKFTKYLSPENPSDIRVKCTACDGNGKAHYTVGTFSDGANSDGQNIIEICPACKGRGYADNVIKT